MSAPVRLIIADDNADLLGAFRCHLAGCDDVELLQTLESADDLNSAIQTNDPDIVLLDLSMPGKPTLDAVREAREHHPRTGAIVLSGYDDQETIDSAFAAGARGFISKLVDFTDIVGVIRHVAGGQVCIRLR